jgi:hypothetical protein
MIAGLNVITITWIICCGDARQPVNRRAYCSLLMALAPLSHCPAVLPRLPGLALYRVVRKALFLGRADSRYPVDLRDFLDVVSSSAHHGGDLPGP